MDTQMSYYSLWRRMPELSEEHIGMITKPSPHLWPSCVLILPFKIDKLHYILNVLDYFTSHIFKLIPFHARPFVA